MTIGRILPHINLGIASTRRRDTEKRVCTFEESVEFYRFNLKLRRYLHDETSIETDLSDQDSGNSMNDDTSFNQDDFVSLLYDTKNIDESIYEHTLLLNDYHKHLSDNPHGSYRDALFNVVGGSGTVLHSTPVSKNVYEESLRSVIGSLYLAKE